MLTKDKIIDRYAQVRRYTVRFSGQDIMDVEGCVREITQSHLEALEEITKLNKEKENNHIHHSTAPGLRHGGYLAKK